MAIAHQIGVAICQQYKGKINGDMFSAFIKTHFQEKYSADAGFQKKKGLFKVDVLYKTVNKARQAFDTVGTIKFSIPPRSPDFNPIENIFNFVKSKLRTQAFEKNIYINYETFEQFYARVKHLLENTPTKYIDKTIEWMSKRMLMVIKSKAQG